MFPFNYRRTLFSNAGRRFLVILCVMVFHTTQLPNQLPTSAWGLYSQECQCFAEGSKVYSYTWSGAKLSSAAWNCVRCKCIVLRHTFLVTQRGIVSSVQGFQVISLSLWDPPASPPGVNYYSWADLRIYRWLVWAPLGALWSRVCFFDTVITLLFTAWKSLHGA